MEKIIVGPIGKGLQTNFEPFNIDNDSFPVLTNAYQWRKRVKRKRGTTFLGRLTRYFDSTSGIYSSSTTITLIQGTGNNGTGNILTGFSLEANGNIVPTTVTINDATNGRVFTDLLGNGTLQGTPTGIGTINYATGVITISNGNAHLVSALFNYTPDLPVMGLETLDTDPSSFPDTLAFDTTYSYNISPLSPFPIYDVSFYKNPAINATTLPGYTPKTNPTRTTWSGQNYRQFWSTNTDGAFWATNGIDIPFTGGNIGMQFKNITGVAIVTAGNGTTIQAVATLTIMAHGLVQGDFIFVNEVQGITGINFQTGYVTSANPQAANTVTVTFPVAILGGAYSGGGIAQYLTAQANPNFDCLRWYDGDPTNGTGSSPPVFVQGNGWVNFMPPLSQSNFSIGNAPPAQYYLVGARMIQPFKDRLLFLGPVIQSSTGSPIYLPDTVIYSQNGTPYYTWSFSGNIFSPTTQEGVLVPVNQTANGTAYWEDQSGFGGFITAGVSQTIVTCESNEDVLILGFSFGQARFIYTGNDIVPFNFYFIDAELSTSSTFSAINMGRSILTRGNRGFVSTTQREADRFDVDILDQNFEINELLNGSERFTAQRDFLDEWIYFTYRSNESTATFPNQTLFFNYRDNSWAIFNESYTTYGQFREQTGLTWATIGTRYPTWASWNAPWNAGTNTIASPDVIAGNQQGFLVVREDSTTDEATSLYIQSVSGNTLTVPDHCLNDGDYITISGCIGLTGLNGNIFSVTLIDNNNFMINPFPTLSGTYSGGGLITRMYVPFIQTKQFPISWALGRKTRIGVQKYLLSTTANSQIQLLIFLSTNAASAYNDGPIVPDPASVNNSLIYSTVLFTCPESTNLGLTPANTNLLMITDGMGTTAQDQIWHRINTSLIGDTVQLGFTMSDAQMRDVNFTNQFSEIELHGFVLEVAPSQMLA